MITSIRTWGALAASFVLATLTVMLAGWVTLPEGAPPALEPAVFACGDVREAPRFLAYDAPARNFGPEVVASDVTTVKAELHRRRCTDPALTAIHAAFNDVGGYELTAESVSANAQALAADPVVWGELISELEASEATQVAVLTEGSGVYSSYGMEEGDSPDAVPQLVADGPFTPSAPKALLVIGSRHYLMECGFQPYLPQPPGTPAAPEPPHGTTPPPPGGHTPGPNPTPTPTPTPTCPPDMPNGTPPNCKSGPSADPQSRGNVPPQAVQTRPAQDNAEEVSRPAEQPVDAGNGIPATSTPRATPSPSSTPEPAWTTPSTPEASLPPVETADPLEPGSG